MNSVWLQEVNKLLTRQTGLLVGLSAIIGFISFLFLIPINWVTEYVSATLIIVLCYNLYTSEKERITILKEAEMQEEQRNSSVVILDKSLSIYIQDDGPDKATYKFSITSAFENKIVDEFKASVSTDRDLSIADLDLDVEGAKLREYTERKIGDRKNFTLTLAPDVPVKRPETWEVSYSIKQHDLLNPEEDWASLTVGEITQRGHLEVVFPPRWQPISPICLDISKDKEEREITVPEIRPYKNDRKCIYWERADLEVGHEYQIRWNGEYV